MSVGCFADTKKPHQVEEVKGMLTPAHGPKLVGTQKVND